MKIKFSDYIKAKGDPWRYFDRISYTIAEEEEKEETSLFDTLQQVKKETNADFLSANPNENPLLPPAERKEDPRASEAMKTLNEGKYFNEEAMSKIELLNKAIIDNAKGTTKEDLYRFIELQKEYKQQEAKLMEEAVTKSRKEKTPWYIAAGGDPMMSSNPVAVAAYKMSEEGIKGQLYPLQKEMDKILSSGKEVVLIFSDQMLIDHDFILNRKYFKNSYIEAIKKETVVFSDRLMSVFKNKPKKIWVKLKFISKYE